MTADHTYQYTATTNKIIRVKNMITFAVQVKGTAGGVTFYVRGRINGGSWNTLVNKDGVSTNSVNSEPNLYDIARYDEVQVITSSVAGTLYYKALSN